MCILLVSTSHPRYPLILLSNRDEVLSRPSARAAFWDAPNNHVLGGRDLQREVHGTWLGITKQGRLAILTNFREDGLKYIEARSRGEIPLAFLTVPPNSKERPHEFAERLVERDGVAGIGGFSLAFAWLKKPNFREGEKLMDEVPDGCPDRKASGITFGIISNRTPDVHGVVWVDQDEWGLSNSRYGDRGWPKVVLGEGMLAEVVREDAAKDTRGKHHDPDALMERCFSLLCTDTLPKRGPDQSWDEYTFELRKSICIPRIGGNDRMENDVDRPVSTMGEVYSTHQQTVVVVDWKGKVTFVERTLFDEKGQPIDEKDRDRRFEFDIQGWDQN